MLMLKVLVQNLVSLHLAFSLVRLLALRGLVWFVA